MPSYSRCLLLSVSYTVAAEVLFTVRPAVIGDERERAAILALAAESVTASHWTPSQFQDVFNSSHRMVFIAEAILNDAVRVVGFIVASGVGRECEIENIAEADSFRRRGMGRALVQQVLRFAAAHGMQAIFLEVRESNTPARAMYESLGFVESGRRKDYYKAPREDAVLYYFAEKTNSKGTART